MSQPKPPDPMLLAAQAQMEKVRSDTAKSVGQQKIDHERLAAETHYKHQALQAKTQTDIQKMELEGRKAGIDAHVQLSTLASQLMRDQDDSDQADQDSQLKQADQQNQSDQVAMQHQQAQERSAVEGGATGYRSTCRRWRKINSGHIRRR